MTDRSDPGGGAGAAPADSDRAELDRQIADYKRRVDAREFVSWADAVWLLNELIYERDHPAGGPPVPARPDLNRELRAIRAELIGIANIGAGARSAEDAANEAIDRATALEHRVTRLIDARFIEEPTDGKLSDVRVCLERDEVRDVRLEGTKKEVTARPGEEPPDEVSEKARRD